MPMAIPYLPPNPCPKYSEDDDDELTQECKSLITSLPEELGWFGTQYHQYQGFWYPTWPLQGLLTCPKHFNARDTDLVLSTTPKAGTTWLKALLYALVNRASQSPGGLDHPLHKSNPHELVPSLEHHLYGDLQVPDLTTLPSPRLFATHFPFQSLPTSIRETLGCKIVYLCRNPKDTFISMWHFANKLRQQHKGGNNISLEEAFHKFCKGVTVYGPYWDHVLDYWKHSLDNPNNIFFLKYEDLKETPLLHLKRLAEFCGCPFSDEEEHQGVAQQILKFCSFDNLSNLEVNKSGKLHAGAEKKSFFRKGEVGDWRNYLSPQMVERIDKITQEKFGPSGLTFQSTINH